DRFRGEDGQSAAGADLRVVHLVAAKTPALAAADLDAAGRDAHAEAELDVPIEGVEGVRQLTAAGAARRCGAALSGPSRPQADAGHAQGHETRRNILALGIENRRSLRNGQVLPDTEDLAVLDEHRAAADHLVRDRVDVAA